GAAQQSLAGGPLGGGVEGFEELYLAAREQRDRQAVAVEETVSRQGGEPWPGRQDAREVERVGAGERHPGTRWRFAAGLAQHADRIGKRELLTGEAGDETAAADLAARLEAPVDAQQVAPWRQPRGL